MPGVAGDATKDYARGTILWDIQAVLNTIIRAIIGASHGGEDACTCSLKTLP